MEEVTHLAKLTAVSALYRDMHLISASLIRRTLHGSTSPLADEAGHSSRDRNAAASDASAFPINDTTSLPDTDVPLGMPLDQRYMDKITCWSALQPNHMETSSMLLHGINLFPPQEAAYPTYVDFDAVVKALEQRKSRKRIKLLRKLRYNQDKLQLKLWDHYVGHQ